MEKRVAFVKKKISDMFINKYFEDAFQGQKYEIELVIEEIPIIKIKNKDDPLCWMMYSNIRYLEFYTKIKNKIIKEHLASLKIQRWWLKKYYDPNFHIIHRVMNRKYDEYNE